jgi:hypothetical protein
MNVRNTVSEFFARFAAFRRTPPVNTVDGYQQFLAERAAFVAQKKLYEYVKQRMGMSYPEHFQKDEFIDSLNVAKLRVYGACLSDLGIWMAAVAGDAGTHDEAKALSKAVFVRTIAERVSPDELRGDPNELVTAFEDRLALANLAMMAQGENAFSHSPKELVRWAPIAEELKRYDTEIVINSLRFAWLAVREDFRRVFEAHAVMEDWRRVSSE